MLRQLVGDDVFFAGWREAFHEQTWFRRAHLGWYGREAETEELEQEFVQYLYFGATPPWVLAARALRNPFSSQAELGELSADADLSPIHLLSHNIPF